MKSSIPTRGNPQQHACVQKQMGGCFFWVRRRNIHCCFFQGICFWAVWLFQPAAWAPEGPPWNTPGLVRSLQKRLQKAPQRAPGGPRAAPGPSGRPGDAPGALWGPPRAAGFKILSLGLLGRQALRLWEGSGGASCLFLNVYKIHLLYVVQGNPPRQDRSCVALN